MKLEELMKVVFCTVQIYDIDNDTTIWKGWYSDIPQAFKKCRVVAVGAAGKDVLDICIEIEGRKE